MKMFKEIWEQFAYDWRRLPAMTRARIRLGFFIIGLGTNSWILISEILGSQGLWSLFIYSVGTLACLFGVLGAVLSFCRPFRYDLDPQRIRRLSERDLKLLEVLIPLSAQEESRLVEHPKLSKAFAAAYDGPANLKHFGLCRLDKNMVASYWALRKAGLVDDRRRRYLDDGILCRPYHEAAAILEGELERRGRPAPIGRRSRPGALSS